MNNDNVGQSLETGPVHCNVDISDSPLGKSFIRSVHFSKSPLKDARIWSTSTNNGVIKCGIRYSRLIPPVRGQLKSVLVVGVALNKAKR